MENGIRDFIGKFEMSVIDEGSGDVYALSCNYGLVSEIVCVGSAPDCAEKFAYLSKFQGFTQTIEEGIELFVDNFVIDDELLPIGEN